MSFICVICRDLLKISEDQEEASPRHHRHQQQQQLLPNNGQSTTITANHHHLVSTTNTASCINNVSGGRRNKGKNNSIVATKCGHLFHYPCLSVWLSQSMNLTTDSKMRCPSCKQLIYIYELIQLFPVETGGGSNNNDDLEQLFSAAFQQKLKVMLEHLDRLCRELSSKKINEMAIGASSPLKGNETPTRLQRVRDSPKKSHTTQLAQLTKEMDSLRVSIRELNSFIEQHAELGSVVERQTREISELRSKNKQLILANERWKSVEANQEDEEKGQVEEASSADKKTVPASHNNNINNNATEDSSSLLLQHKNKKDCHQTTQAVTTTAVATAEIFMRTAQDSRKDSGSKEDHLMSNQCSKVSNASTDSSSNNSRRKSVTFLDPFEEFDEEVNVKVAKTNIPFETKDFRVGDKVVWRFEGNLEVGTVKWKGFIGSQINVGVEFERQLGLPIKDLSSDALQCIFKCKPGHGRLIPVQEVVLYNKEIMKNSNHPATAYQCGSCNNTSSSNGINKRIQSCTHQ